MTNRDILCGLFTHLLEPKIITESISEHTRTAYDYIIGENKIHVEELDGEIIMIYVNDKQLI